MYYVLCIDCLRSTRRSQSWFLECCEILNQINHYEKYLTIILWIKFYNKTPTKVPLHTQRSILAHPPSPKCPCTPRDVYLHTHQSAPAHLEMYTCTPTKVPLHTQRCILAHPPSPKCPCTPRDVSLHTQQSVPSHPPSRIWCDQVTVSQDSGQISPMSPNHRWRDTCPAGTLSLNIEVSHEDRFHCTCPSHCPVFQPENVPRWLTSSIGNLEFRFDSTHCCKYKYPGVPCKYRRAKLHFWTAIKFLRCGDYSRSIRLIYYFYVNNLQRVIIIMFGWFTAMIFR